MREMKNSGVAWIGEIPKDWDLSRLKFSSTYNDESIKEDTNPEKEIEYVEIGSVTLENGVEKAEVMRFKDAPSRARRIARKGDIIISTVRTYLKAIALIEKESYTVSTGFCVIRPQKCMDSGYLKYFCSSELFTSEVSACSVGISYPAINASTLMDFHIINPPLAVQHKIVRILDEKCNHVDSIIANVQAQIEKLKAYKQSLITEVVTKGLDPNAPMKDSGVEWIGKIPAHWGTAKLQYCAELRSGITLGKKYPKDIKLVERPYLRVANVQSGGVTLENIKTVQVTEEEDAQYRLTAGEVLMTEGGDRDKLGRGCVWNGQIEPCLHQNHIFALRTSKNLDPQFLSYVTASKIGRVYFDITAIKTTNLACTNSSKVLAFKLPLPPITEQQRITVHLNNKCSQIEQLISLKESKIE